MKTVKRFPLSQGFYSYLNFLKSVCIVIGFFMPAFKSSAQAITWTDNFVQFQAPTNEQCNNWSNFLGRLVPTNYYASVRISGSYDTTGISITDPAAAQQLANLLYTRTAGSVTSDGHTWYVGLGCQDEGSCVPYGQGVDITIDQPFNCQCDNSYTIRPHIGNYSWGGIGGDNTCNPSSQTMSLEFDTGATITASGPTTLCQGDSVILTASSSQCVGPYTYLWSTGETTQSITVSQSGDYSVTINSTNSCSFYNSIKITVSPNPTISAGQDVMICANPAQLNATVISGGASSTSVTASICLFDASGGGDCTFTNSLCDDGYQFVSESQQFSQPTSITVTPAGINFRLYYSACSQSTTFTFKLNDNVIGSFFEDVVSCACDPSSAGQYPRIISFDPSQFQQFWNPNAVNSLAVDVVSDGEGIALAGIVAEILSPNETYRWAPVAGLSDSTIHNPMVTPPSVSTAYKVTYTNSSGCSAESQVTVNVTCNQPPISVCKSITVSASNNCVGNAVASDFNEGSIDPDGGVLTYNVSPAGPYPIGVTTVQLTVTDSDNMSSSCEATITVVDDVSPVVVTKNVTVQLDASGAGSIAVADVNNGSSDNCGIATYTLSTSNFDCTSIGTNTVILTLTDVNGNSSSGSAIITVLDNSPPVITCPSTIAVNNNVNTCGALVNYDPPSITDSCSGGTLNNPIINGSFESGNYEGWQLSSSSCGTFAIGVAGQTIYPGEDIFDHANNAVETANSPGLPYTPTPSDGNRMGVFLQNCGSAHNLYQDVTLPLGSISLCLDLGYNNLSPGGFTTSQFIAIELRNPVNNAVYTTLFKTLSGSPATRPLSNLCFDISAFAGQQVRIQIMDASIKDYYMDVFYDNIRIVGGTSIVQTAGLPSGSIFPVGTTTNSFRATDGAGNSSFGSFDVIVTDNQPPTAVVQNRVIQLNSAGTASILPADINNGSTDNCSIALFSLSKTNFDCTNIGGNAVILTVIDANGNTSSATAIVTVMDTIPPTAIAKNLTIYLDSTGAAPISASTVDNGSSDNCGIATMTLSKTSFDCTNVGTVNTVILTVTDVNGNISTATSTISVVDSIAPTIIGLPSNIILGACGASATWTAPTASDNCAGVTIVQTAGPVSGDLTAFVNGTTQNITYTATDASGNSTIATFTVTRPAALTSSMTTNNSYIHFGYTPDQFANITIAPSNGVGPYSVSVTMGRPLSCSLVSGWDNETWYATNATNNNNSCSILLPPVSVGNVSSDGALTLSVSLMADALITAIIHDANGCIATNQINIGAEDDRCVGVLSGTNIQICHKVSKNECTPMCVDQSAVDAHIAHGDYLGTCNISCAAPPSSASAKVESVATTSPTAVSDESVSNESALKDTDIVVEAYPNPFRSSIHVKLSNPEEKLVSMNIVDLLGRNVALKPADKTPEGTHVLDTEQLAIGMYFLQVKIGDRSKTIKLEKK